MNGIIKRMAFVVIIATMFCFSNLFAQQGNDSTIVEVTIKTSAECGMCKDRIEKAVNDLSGIKYSNLDVDSKILTVKYDSDETNPDKIRKAVSLVGYDADDIKANKKAYKQLPKCCQKGGHK